mgnify:CR=1 FL=1
MKREESIGWMIKAVASWIDEQLKIGLESICLTRGQFAIMMTLLEEDGLTQVEIGRRISMPGYATSRNIDELESRNLLKRKPHESTRRSYRIFITEQGRELAPSIYDVAYNLREHLLESFDDKEVKTLRLLLFQMVRSISDKTEKS